MRTARSNAGQKPHDIIVVGGGPAGSTAALRATQSGLRAVLLEQAKHPRFHIGESFLPRNMGLIDELGLRDRVARIPQTRKLGASFAFGNEETPTDFYFKNGLLDTSPETVNVERGPFDKALLDAAKDGGVEVREGWTVRSIARMNEDGVSVEAVDADGGAQTFEAKHLIDATGQSTLVGRHLRTRRTLSDLKRVAYFGHFRGVEHPSDIRSGFPLVLMCDEGWFWFIPIGEDRMSIGLVIEAKLSKQIDVPAKRMLAWGIERCPLARHKTRNVDLGRDNHVTADFSYACRPYAGPGYFLVGDAATFLDPIFSTGVCLGMMSGTHAVDTIRAIHDGRVSPRAGQRAHCRYVDRSSSIFFWLVRSFYKHHFRELFLHGVGPVSVHRAMISVLTGHVFPRPALSLRWRLQLMRPIAGLQRLIPLVPRRERFSLVGMG